ncbi:nuclear factor of activated T-cells 5-like [Conger conger]|uniref:nuclear factor of activated T-cells 5-like n=1 Tax=Conger conger TaxID=82655 RepID=UPI002A5A623A|nr:nuclear factor of activated T-cells 5-like [Conger conger]
MPSDFISLLSADFDVNSPKSLYSKDQNVLVSDGPGGTNESVYDLLPKELQLPSSTESNTAAMSQKSGGEAGPPPLAALASDATSTSSSMSAGGPSSALPASSSPTAQPCTSVTDQSVHSGCSPGEGVSSLAAADVLGEDGRLSGAGGGGRQADGGGGGAGCGAQHLQTTPTKRRTVLNISPPPEDLLDDSRMSCQDEPAQDSEHSGSLWMDDSASSFSLLSCGSYNDNSALPRKSRKRGPRQRPGPRPVSAQEVSMDVFDADSAQAPHFVLSQLGPDGKACPKGSSTDSSQLGGQKGGVLAGQYPVKGEGKELKILVQPETQHRARYLTEGSRGSVKDRTQQGFPTVKLEGLNEPVVLQVFVGNDAGRVKPHGFYQACRVTGRNTTACKEVDIEGTTVIEVCLDPSTNMSLAVDCVGILKLRNADVEARIGVAGSKKKSTRARLVFRVNIPRPDGSILTLQTPSSPILCTQPAGVPEILKKSLHSCSVKGGEEVFLIGKNFLKGTKVLFQENVSDEESWKAQAEIDMELFHQNHLVVKVPPYQNLAISSPVSVGIYVVTNAGRSHDVQPFTYTPEPENMVDVSVKEESPAPAKPCPFEEQIAVIQSGSCLDSALMHPMMPLVKREEVTPMELSSASSAPSVFKPTSDTVGSPQQSVEMSPSIPANGSSPYPSPYPSPLPRPPGGPEPPQAYGSAAPLGALQKQDLVGGGPFAAGRDALLQQQQPFLLDGGEGLAVEQPPPQKQPLPLFPQDGGAQLERAVRQLQAGGFGPQLSSVLFSDRARQQQERPAEGSVAEQQQQLQSELYQCGLFQGAPRSGTPEQQGSPQAMVQNHAALFHSRPQQQQQQQQAALFQQAGELLSIQTSTFLQQAPSHPSPPQQLFHTPSPLGEVQDPQGALFQTTLTMLTGSSLSSPDQQPAGPALFLPDSQQAVPQPPQAVFQGLSPHTPASTLPPAPQQQAGLLYCGSGHGAREQPGGLLFSQGQGTPPPQETHSAPLLFSQAGVMQAAEPMSFQDQSSETGAQQGRDGPRQGLFQDQQPMQVGPGPEQPVALFMPQTAIFAAPNGVAGLRTSSSSPVQPQPSSLFQTAVSGALTQPGQTQQTGLFLFGIQNECGQLINSAGPTLCDQLIAISQSGQRQGQGQRHSDAQIQALLGQSMCESGTAPNSLNTSQNMEKIDDLLVSLQEQSDSLSRSY